MHKLKRETHKLLADAGAVFVRHGTKHDIYRLPDGRLVGVSGSRDTRSLNFLRLYAKRNRK